MRIAASFSGAMWYAGASFAVALLSSCATPPSDPAARAAFEQSNDPLEPLNRQTLEVNMFLDRILLKPVTKIYIAILPEQARDAVKRALDNMKEPVVVINNTLQGEVRRAGISVGRFVINSTAGVAGLYDVAEHLGLEKQNGDFGQTLYVWGFPQGPYLILPLLGPSNPRDAVGMGIDAFIDPFSYVATAADIDQMQIARFVIDGIDQRARVIDVLDDLQKNSLDFYAELRSLSQQHRASELQHGKAAEPGSSFYDDPGSKGAAAAPAAAATPMPADKTPPGKPSLSMSQGVSLTLPAASPNAAATDAPDRPRPLAAAPLQIPSDVTPAR